jgi:hypothetical protein
MVIVIKPNSCHLLAKSAGVFFWRSIVELFSKLKAESKHKMATLQEQYFNLLLQGDDASEADIEALLMLMESLGISDEEAKQHHDAIKHYKRLQAQIEAQNEWNNKATEAKKKVEVYHAETIRLTELRRSEFDRLSAELNIAERQASNAVHAQHEQRELVANNPLFTGKRVK